MISRMKVLTFLDVNLILFNKWVWHTFTYKSLPIMLCSWDKSFLNHRQKISITLRQEACWATSASRTTRRILRKGYCLTALYRCSQTGKWLDLRVLNFSFRHLFMLFWTRTISKTSMLMCFVYGAFSDLRDVKIPPGPRLLIIDRIQR